MATSNYFHGKLIKKMPSGHWLVRANGKNIIAKPITDEPIKINAKLTLIEIQKKYYVLGGKK